MTRGGKQKRTGILGWSFWKPTRSGRSPQSRCGSQLADSFPQTLNFDYMMDNQPFEELPWQYFPKPKIDHRPPIFVYGFPLKSDVSEIEHIAHVAGILKPEEPLTGRNVMSTLPRTMKYLGRECGLLREDSLSVDGCYCRTVRFVLKLKTNYNPGHIPPEKLEHVIDVLKKYLPEKTPRWFLDPDIVDMERRNFEIPGSSFRHRRDAYVAESHLH